MSGCASDKGAASVWGRASAAQVLLRMFLAAIESAKPRTVERPSSGLMLTPAVLSAVSSSATQQINVSVCEAISAMSSSSIVKPSSRAIAGCMPPSTRRADRAARPRTLKTGGAVGGGCGIGGSSVPPEAVAAIFSTFWLVGRGNRVTGEKPNAGCATRHSARPTSSRDAMAGLGVAFPARGASKVQRMSKASSRADERAEASAATLEAPHPMLSMLAAATRERE
jgi:hypothetical protein